MSAGTAPTPKIYEVDDAGQPVEPVLDTPEGQWIIDDSDEEEEAPLHEPTAQEMLEHIQDERMGRKTEMALDWLIWTMPFAFAFILMDVLVQQQYGEKPTIWGECKTFVTRVPGLGLLVYWGMWHYTVTITDDGVLYEKRQRLVQTVLFMLGTVTGALFLKIVTRDPYLAVMKQSPPLGTLWIFSVVRLDLLPACISLGIIAAYVKYTRLPVFGP